MDARLIWWDEKDFSEKYSYWGASGGTPVYANFMYFNYEPLRQNFETFVEQNEDELGNKVVTYERKIEAVRFLIPAAKPILGLLLNIGLHERIQLELIKTGQLYELGRVTVVDNGGEQDNVAGVIISAEMSGVQRTDCENDIFTVVGC